ncbi:MAG: ROK family protein [Candidatus Omnitrophica bacterium]|nr:ROK family protein [Candidatus Omnitrophota bacterium]
MMARTKKTVRAFRVCPENEKDQFRLDILGILKTEKKPSISEISKRAGEPADKVAGFINSCVKKDILEVSGDKGETVKFNTSYGRILGVGFNYEECVLTVMDLKGETLDREIINVGLLNKIKGKNKEIKEIVSKIDEASRLKDSEFCCAGLAVSSILSEKNSKASDILADGISRTFGCDVYITSDTTAAGYGERDFGSVTGGEDVLYMYSDVGDGVVLKGEMIFEAREKDNGDTSEYLRSWSQFSIVETAKNLVGKGVGTDIVNMVDGDIDAITLEVVLRAADNDDELAEDLVKRSGLALGVRIAYLVNMFNTGMVILGGGTEKKEGRFLDFVKESSARFLHKEKKQNLKIVPGKLGEEAPSIGAASLCRRELFMEG